MQNSRYDQDQIELTNFDRPLPPYPYDQQNDITPSTLRRRHSPRANRENRPGKGSGGNNHNNNMKHDYYEDPYSPTEREEKFEKQKFINVNDTQEPYDGDYDFDIRKPPLRDDPRGGIIEVGANDYTPVNRDMFVRPTRRPTFSNRCQLCWLVVFNIVIGCGFLKSLLVVLFIFLSQEKKKKNHPFQKPTFLHPNIFHFHDYSLRINPKTTTYRKLSNRVTISVFYHHLFSGQHFSS